MQEVFCMLPLLTNGTRLAAVAGRRARVLGSTTATEAQETAEAAILEAGCGPEGKIMWEWGRGRREASG